MGASVNYQGIGRTVIKYSLMKQVKYLKHEQNVKPWDYRFYAFNLEP